MMMDPSKQAEQAAEVGALTRDVWIAAILVLVLVIISSTVSTDEQTEGKQDQADKGLHNTVSVLLPRDLKLDKH